MKDSAAGKVLYVHDETIHNTDSPAAIVPYVMRLLNPHSVVDIGCGTGTFLKVFKQHGVAEVLGYDGKWVNRELLLKNVDPEEFREADLETRIETGKKYDLAVCLEVGEHLHEQVADILVQNLAGFSDNILFSAAIPGQGGQNHINEQYLEYWVEKFARSGFHFYDILRPVLWNNADVSWWYRQNIVLFSRRTDLAGLPVYKELVQHKIVSPAHPMLVNSLRYNLAKSRKLLDNVYEGRLTMADYLRLMLKAIIIKLGLKNIARRMVGKGAGARFKSSPYK